MQRNFGLLIVLLGTLMAALSPPPDALEAQVLNTYCREKDNGCSSYSEDTCNAPSGTPSSEMFCRRCKKQDKNWERKDCATGSTSLGCSLSVKRCGKIQQTNCFGNGCANNWTDTPSSCNAPTSVMVPNGAMMCELSEDPKHVN